MCFVAVTELKWGKKWCFIDTTVNHATHYDHYCKWAETYDDALSSLLCSMTPKCHTCSAFKPFTLLPPQFSERNCRLDILTRWKSFALFFHEVNEKLVHISRTKCMWLRNILVTFFTYCTSIGCQFWSIYESKIPFLWASLVSLRHKLP